MRSGCQKVLCKYLLLLVLKIVEKTSVALIGVPGINTYRVKPLTSPRIGRGLEARPMLMLFIVSY